MLPPCPVGVAQPFREPFLAAVPPRRGLVVAGESGPPSVLRMLALTTDMDLLNDTVMSVYAAGWREACAASRSSSSRRSAAAGASPPQTARADPRNAGNSPTHRPSVFAVAGWICL